MTYTPTRDDDVALAEAIGCKVGTFPKFAGYTEDFQTCECPGHPHGTGTIISSTHRRDGGHVFTINPYATAPTGDTMLQLIEGLAAKGYEVEMQQCGGFAICRIRNQAGVVIVDLNAATLPAAVSQAALRAIQTPSSSISQRLECRPIWECCSCGYVDTCHCRSSESACCQQPLRAIGKGGEE